MLHLAKHDYSRSLIVERDAFILTAQEYILSTLKIRLVIKIRSRKDKSLRALGRLDGKHCNTNVFHSGLNPKYLSVKKRDFFLVISVKVDITDSFF